MRPPPWPVRLLAGGCTLALAGAWMSLAIHGAMRLPGISLGLSGGCATNRPPGLAYLGGVLGAMGSLMLAVGGLRALQAHEWRGARQELRGLAVRCALVACAWAPVFVLSVTGPRGCGD